MCLRVRVCEHVCACVSAHACKYVHLHACIHKSVCEDERCGGGGGVHNCYECVHECAYASMHAHDHVHS